MRLKKSALKMSQAQSNLYEAYRVGDSDTRPWGGYIVTNVARDDAAGEDIVEKDITVNAGQMLSVQSHVGRREIWMAVQGTLTALINGTAHTVPEGQSIEIPKGAIHAIINRGTDSIIVHEIQRGICDENDNTRYFDQSGRPTVASDDPNVAASIATYRRIMDEIAKG